MNKEKSVDESWKEQASSEKDVLSTQKGDERVEETSSKDQAGPEAKDESASEGDFEVNFINYITSLGFQAMIFMGEIPNPVSNSVDKNLDQAKFLIDTLTMLKEKTQGNLNDQEKSLLESSVYELQLKYVQSTSGEQEKES